MLFYLLNREVRYGIESNKPNYKTKKRRDSLIFKNFFSREEARQVALQYTWGLISKAERKNTWQLAEEAGLQTPYTFQHLLRRGF
jgi:hypothetical protein